MQIALHGVPRSGTTWLAEIFNSSPHVIYKYQPLFSYALKGYLNERSTAGEICEFFEKLRFLSDEFMDRVPQRELGQLPRFLKTTPTHLVYKEVRYHGILSNLVRQAREPFRIILIVRNPLAVVHSWLEAPREFRKDLGWNELEEWRHAEKKNLGRPEEFNGFEKWKHATHIFCDIAEKYPDRAKLIRYSDLYSAPLSVTKQLFDFCELDVGQQTQNFIQDSRTQHVEDAYAVFRASNPDEKWRRSLHPMIVEEIRRDLNGTPLQVFLD